MKTIVLVLSLMASSAFANIKPHGQFIPSECGKGAEVEICMGVRNRLPGQYVSIKVKGGETAIFEVKKATRINGGINPSFTAVEYELAARPFTARLAVYSQNGRAQHATVIFPDGTTVSVGAFNIVAVTL